jgi:hypothetical protein
VIQVITTLFGVLLVERLMASPLAGGMNHRIRRLAFTTALAMIMAIAYYALGRVDLKAADGGTIAMAPVPVAIVISVLSSAAMVLSLGKRAEFWREFVEKEESEAEEFEDEEVTSSVGRAKAAQTSR